MRRPLDVSTPVRQARLAMPAVPGSYPARRIPQCDGAPQHMALCAYAHMLAQHVMPARADPLRTTGCLAKPRTLVRGVLCLRNIPGGLYRCF